MLRLKLTLARLARAMSRRLGRGGGTTLPGRLLLRLDKHAIGRLGRRLEAGTVLLSATNGKTTTASMIAGILKRTGQPVVRNAAGSNMHWGIATALIDAGREHSELGLVEVDEAWLPAVARELQPETFVLCNLFRDQLDRYGELELLADRWADLVEERAGSARFVLNADDPLVADLGRERPGVIYFGISDDSQALPELQHASDSKHCRNCGTPYDYEAVYLGHIGRYRCPGCGRERPEPEVVAERIELDGMAGSRVSLSTPAGATEIRLPLPGLYNVYNAVAAAAAAMELGASLDDVKASLEAQTAAFGRVETIPVEGRDVSILLVKNPAGTNEVLRTLTLEGHDLDLWIALNDKIADGRDVSWVWDADFELLAGRVRRVTCSGTRAEEMALRLKYAGIDAELEVERDLWRSLESAVSGVDGSGRLFALPTYTALLELRDLLAERGLARPWAG
jgi:lipid II isoglutaminyl synthase (glutamine-hydrolysing)